MSYGFSSVAAFFVIGLVVLFIWQSLPVWKQEGTGFLSGTNWFYRQAQFGALPMIYGTGNAASDDVDDQVEARD